jgi:DNA invertase Pin-like site-specific DNA recombinase
VNIDGDENNNALSNLKYQSRSDYLRENMSGTVVLSKSEVAEIIDRISNGESKTSVAQLMGVSVPTISRLWSEYEQEHPTTT